MLLSAQRFVHTFMVPLSFSAATTTHLAGRQSPISQPVKYLHMQADVLSRDKRKMVDAQILNSGLQEAR